MGSNNEDNKYKIFFDYIYYRLTQFFIKRDGSNGWTGLAIMTVVQTLFLGLVFDHVVKSDWFPYVLEKGVAGTVGIVIGATLFFYNKSLYDGRYNKFREFWKNETPEERSSNGFWVLMFFVIPIALIILFG